ncbi:MAG: hypothetical protein HZB26_12435 [Candidatus Hydrogenedentes bacterium]|nr:hypothetical protein [Candidatus Hydrogenedentota bacterium]
MTLRIRVQVSLFFLVVWWSITLPAAALDVPLEVKEPSGVTRSAEPVTVGVPLPNTPGFTNTASLALYDGATVIPAQFRVLSRWGGTVDAADCPLRWVLVDFQAALTANETRTYHLKDTGPVTAPATSLTVDASDPAVLLIDTGAMTVTLNRQRGNLIDRVVVNGQIVSDDPTTERLRSGVQMVVEGGGVYRAGYASNPEVVVEEQGPVRVTVRVVTNLADSSGTSLRGGNVRVTHRLTFHANSAEIGLRTWLENNATFGDPGNGGAIPENILYFDSMVMDVPLAISGTRTVRTQGYEGTGADTDTWRVYQAHQLTNLNDESENFTYTIMHNVGQATTGTRHDGWIDVADANGGVTAGVRWFWQNYEKALSVSQNTVSLEFWPHEGVYPPTRTDLYQVEGGRHKGYEAVLEFHSSAPNSALMTARLTRPLIARAPSAWYFTTGAMGITDPGDQVFSGTYDDSRMNTAYARYNDLMRKRADGIAPDGGRYVNNIAEAREKRFVIGSYGTTDWYGWAHFGDCAWADGYSSNHYDMPGFALLHFLRTGDRALFDQFEPHVRQASEWGQIWGIDPNVCVASISFYEKVTHGLAVDGYRQAPSHNWIRRLVYYHWMTGDEMAKAAAIFNGEALDRYWNGCFDVTNPASMDLGAEQWSPLNEPRHLTWTIDNALALYDMTGETRWMTLAENCMRCVLYSYHKYGHANGYGASVLGRNLQTHYGAEPAVRFHQQSTNVSLRADVLDMLRGIITATYDQDRSESSGTGAAYYPAILADDWDWGRPNPESNDTIFNGFAASVYAYVGWLDHNSDYIRIADKLWSDFVFYPEYSPIYPARDYRNYASWDTWGWASSAYPGSDEKVFARETREGIPYLWVRAEMASGTSIDADIDGSGHVDATDVQLVINAALGIPITGASDINHDGQTDAVDVQLVINAALGFV